MDIRGWEFYGVSGLPVSGAAVDWWPASLTTPGGAASGSTTTDANGKWAFTGLTSQAVDVRVTFNGRYKWYKGLTQFTLGAITGVVSVSGLGARITGDFTTAGTTLATTGQVLFQTETANSNTIIGAVPSGSARVARYVAHNAVDPFNACNIDLRATSTIVGINVGLTGTGTALPFTITNTPTVGAPVERLRLHVSGGLSLGNTTDPGAGNLSVTGTVAATGAGSFASLVLTGALTVGTALTVGARVDSGSTVTVGSTDFAVVTSAATPTISLPTTPTLGRVLIVKHRGSGNATLNVTGGGTTIWDTSLAVSSLTMLPGDAITVLGDGTYWNIV
jgi:hypothetical protein